MCWRFNVVILNVVVINIIGIAAVVLVGFVVVTVKAGSKNKTIFIWRRCRRCFKVILEESFAHVCVRIHICVCMSSWRKHSAGAGNAWRAVYGRQVLSASAGCLADDC